MNAKCLAGLAAGWIGVALTATVVGAQQSPQQQAPRQQAPQQQAPLEQAPQARAPRQQAPELQFLQQPLSQPAMRQQAEQTVQQPAQQGQPQARQTVQEPQQQQPVPLSQAPSMRPEPISEARRAALDEAVRERLRVNFPSLHDNVRVEVTDVGVVRLTGSVGSVAAELAVGNIAAQVPDYDYLVVNEVTVRPPRRQDQAIAQDIRQAFARDPYLRSANVRVDVRDQTAFLEGGAAAEGPVDQLVVIDRALQLAARVPGVREVNTDGIL